MEDNQLFADIETFVSLNNIVPNVLGSDDCVRQEYQYMRWSESPYVEDQRVRIHLNLSENDTRVRVLDYLDVEGGQLQLIHFLPEEMHLHTPPEGVEDCRGLVFFVPFNLDEPVKLLARSFPYTPELVLLADKEKEIEEKIVDFAPTSAVVAHEGTILRLFIFNGKWYYSTHRKINGLRSRWTGDSFGKIFEKILPNFDDSVLNPDYCYVLLLEDIHTGLVCSDIGNGAVYHTITIDMQTGNLVNKPLNVIGRLADQIVPDMSLILNRVRLVFPMKECGVLLKNDKGEYLKILNSKYCAAREFLNNEPSLGIRYLELKLYNQHNNLAQLLPRGKEKYETIERLLPHMAEYLGHLWYCRDYKGQYLNIDKKCYETLRAVQFFESINNYVHGTPSPSLAHVKNLAIQSVRMISNPRHVNNIIKLMKNDYDTYHTQQTEWSDLF